MRSRYTSQSGKETFYDEVDSAFSDRTGATDYTDGTVGMGTTMQEGSNPAVLNPTGSATETDYSVGQGMNTGTAEALVVLVVHSSTRWHSQSGHCYYSHKSPGRVPQKVSGLESNSWS